MKTELKDLITYHTNFCHGGFDVAFRTEWLNPDYRNYHNKSITLFESDKFDIKSYDSPFFSQTTLGLHGRNSDESDNMIFCSFDTCEEAEEYMQLLHDTLYAWWESVQSNSMWKRGETAEDIWKDVCDDCDNYCEDCVVSIE